MDLTAIMESEKYKKVTPKELGRAIAKLRETFSWKEISKRTGKPIPELMRLYEDSKKSK